MIVVIVWKADRVNNGTSISKKANTSRSAGPFMSRDLLLASCADTDEKFKRWIIKTGD